MYKRKRPEQDDDEHKRSPDSEATAKRSRRSESGSSTPTRKQKGSISRSRSSTPALVYKTWGWRFTLERNENFGASNRDIDNEAQKGIESLPTCREHLMPGTIWNPRRSLVRIDMQKNNYDDERKTHFANIQIQCNKGKGGGNAGINESTIAAALIETDKNGEPLTSIESLQEALRKSLEQKDPTCLCRVEQFKK